MKNYEKIYKQLIKNYIFDGNYIENGEKSEIVFQDAFAKIEIIISCGYKSPDNFWYDQSEKETVYILQGEGILEFSDKKQPLKKGDLLTIEPNQKHRVSYTSKNPPCVWLCLFEKNYSD